MMQRPVTGKAELTMMTLPYKAGVIMLLLCYLAAFVYSPVGVPHVHHEDEALHSEDSEKDACHIAIYHPGSKGQCGHKFHFSQAIKECDLCQLVLPRQFVAPLGSHAEMYVAFSIVNFNYHLIQIWPSDPEQAGRGPPSLI